MSLRKIHKAGVFLKRGCKQPWFMQKSETFLTELYMYVTSQASHGVLLPRKPPSNAASETLPLPHGPVQPLQVLLFTGHISIVSRDWRSLLMSRYMHVKSFLWCTKLLSNWRKPQNNSLLRSEKHQRANEEPKKNENGLRMKKIKTDCEWRTWKI